MGKNKTIKIKRAMIWAEGGQVRLGELLLSLLYYFPCAAPCPPLVDSRVPGRGLLAEAGGG